MNTPIPIRVKRLVPEAILPKYNHEGEDAAFDLFTPTSFYLFHDKPVKHPLGIAVEIPVGYYAHVLGRSGLANKGVCILGGVIDAGYRGGWHVQMINLGDASSQLFFAAGDKIAQCVITPCPACHIIEASELSASQRGTKAFGSSDVK